MWNHTLPASRRGYGTAHRKRRAALLPFAYGKPCPMCGETMELTQKLALDHSTPLALGGTVGDRIVHYSCNHRAGSKLGAAIAMARKNPTPERDW